MPDMPEINKSMEDRISFFYNRASILPSNKFLVGLYGPYVNQALRKLARDAKFNLDSTTNKIYSDNKIYQSHLQKFTTDHVNGGDEVELKWAVKGVTIPTIQTEMIEDINIDAIKTINYPLIKGHAPTGTIKLDIVENRSMTMYHFFNALMNRFFTPQTLKPKSSFHKLGMYIIVLNQDILNAQAKENATDNRTQPKQTKMNDIPVQIFEFNSITPMGMTDLPLSHEMPTKKLEFSISFKAPNLFQSSFKTLNEFKGMRDNTSDKALSKIYKIHTDVGGMQESSEYQRFNSSTPEDPLYVFEVKNTDASLKSPSNGYFIDDV